MSNIHGNQIWPFVYVRVTTRFVLSFHVSGFLFRIKTKHVRQGLPRICQGFKEATYKPLVMSNSGQIY